MQHHLGSFHCIHFSFYYLPSIDFWTKSGWACSWSPPTRRYIAWHENKKNIYIMLQKGLTNQVCWEQKTLACTNNNIPTLNWSRNCNLSSSNVVIFFLWRTLFCRGSVKINSHICKWISRSIIYFAIFPIKQSQGSIPGNPVCLTYKPLKV